MKLNFGAPSGNDSIPSTPVGNSFMPNSQVEQISWLINRARLKQDKLDAAVKEEQRVLAELRAQERKLREEFELQISQHLLQQSSQTMNIQALLGSVANNKDELLKLQQDLAAALQEQQDSEQMAAMAKELEEILSQIPAWQQAKDFQKTGVLAMYKAYLDGMNGFANFDDMGGGKTLQAILFIMIMTIKFAQQHDGRKPKILWITNKPLIPGTLGEFQHWAPTQPVFPMSFGVGRNTTPAERTMMYTMGMQLNAVMIGNYEVLNTMPEIVATEWDLVVIDEVHRLKGGANQKQTGIFKAALKVCRNAHFIAMLSGTPMVNKVSEMWSYLHIFDPDRFPNLRKFENMFAKMHPIKGLVISADYLLKNALAGQCIRRSREEFGTELPGLFRPIHILQMGDAQRFHYDEIFKHFSMWIGAKNDNELIPISAMIARLNRMRQVNVWPMGVKVSMHSDEGHDSIGTIDCPESSKIDECMEIIDELDAQDEQVLVFSTFNEPLFEVQRRCHDKGITCKVLHGQSKEANLEHQFQQKEVQVLCIQSQMGFGMNLQKNKDRWPGGASQAIMLDLWWSPARNEQCEARIHREGAIENCQVHILYNEDSVDALVAAILEDKSSAFSNIMDRKELRPASYWKALIKEHLG